MGNAVTKHMPKKGGNFIHAYFLYWYRVKSRKPDQLVDLITLRCLMKWAWIYWSFDKLIRFTRLDPVWKSDQYNLNSDRVKWLDIKLSYFQHVKLSHCSYITLLKLKYILFKAVWRLLQWNQLVCGLTSVLEQLMVWPGATYLVLISNHCDTIIMIVTQLMCYKGAVIIYSKVDGANPEIVCTQNLPPPSELVRWNLAPL